MNAKQILKTLNYLPRWVWYVLSLSIGGPPGALGVYIVFRILTKKAAEQEEEDREPAARRFGETYEDEECIVTSDEEIAREWAQTEASAARAREAQAAQPIGENATADEVIRSGYDAMRRIRQANDTIADEALSRQIDSIELSCGQILSLLQERQNLLPQLRTFLRYYLPTTLRLLDARAKLENTASTPKAREVRARISEALGVIDKAFIKQVEALDAYRFIDLESEMDVLRDMLKADGLLSEDEDPFGAATGGR